MALSSEHDLFCRLEVGNNNTMSHCVQCSKECFLQRHQGAVPTLRIFFALLCTNEACLPGSYHLSQGEQHVRFQQTLRMIEIA
eukprot:4249363-Amphidinium_carterae.1